MKLVTLVFLAAVVTVAFAAGQYYVPRAYYMIDQDGHETAPIPLRRLKRSYNPYYPSRSEANANANANAYSGGGGGSASANANANAYAGAGRGSYYPPIGQGVGASNPAAIRSGGFAQQSGPLLGAQSITASTSVGLGPSGQGFYDQRASVQ